MPNGAASVPGPCLANVGGGAHAGALAPSTGR